MPNKQHHYSVTVTWTGNAGSGTATPRAYSRAHTLSVEGKAEIAGSSDPSFRGDATRWNPEDLLVGSLAACHKLWYLGLCAAAGIVVTAYEDHAEGVMEEAATGEGQFVSVTLRPVVTLAAGADIEAARALHHTAHEKCFIARSVNFPVAHAPTFLVAAG